MGILCGGRQAVVIVFSHTSLSDWESTEIWRLSRDSLRCLNRWFDLFGGFAEGVERLRVDFHCRHGRRDFNQLLMSFLLARWLDTDRNSIWVTFLDWVIGHYRICCRNKARCRTSRGMRVMNLDWVAYRCLERIFVRILVRFVNIRKAHLYIRSLFLISQVVDIVLLLIFGTPGVFYAYALVTNSSHLLPLPHYVPLVYQTGSLTGVAASHEKVQRISIDFLKLAEFLSIQLICIVACIVR